MLCVAGTLGNKPRPIVSMLCVSALYLLMRPVARAFAWRVVDLGSIPAFTIWIFLGQAMSVIEKLVLQWQPCQAPGVIGSVLGLVGLGEMESFDLLLLSQCSYTYNCLRRSVSKIH